MVFVGVVRFGTAKKCACPSLWLLQWKTRMGFEKSLILLMSNHLNKPSLTALLLGLGGLIPFVGLASLYVLTSGTHQQTLLFSLLAYGATIISFLGAIHWGLSMGEDSPNNLRLVWGVLPSLGAWLCLMFSPHLGLALECLILWVCFFVDYKTYPTFNLSAWLKLRFVLTLVASLSLLTPLAVSSFQHI